MSSTTSTGSTPSPAVPLLEVKDLCVTSLQGEVLLKNLSFTIRAGQCLAIIGESGSGKTLTSRALVGLPAPNLQTSGKIIFNAKDLLALPSNHRDWQTLRGKHIAYVPQHGGTAFNPLFSIEIQVMETLHQHLRGQTSSLNPLIQQSFNAVALPHYQEIFSKYPHELSGGTLQRVMIALALMLKSEIIIADEPGSSIDWLNKKEVLGFFKHAVSEHGQALLLITHDFAEVQALADDVLVLQNGILVEQGSAHQVLKQPQHPYTCELIHARAQLDAQFNQLTSPLSQREE